MYSMQFRGTAAPSGEGEMKATLSATSCDIRTLVGVDGVDGKVTAAEGGMAYFESAVKMTGPDSFQETGKISFGEDGHALTFSTVGQGHLGPSVEEKTMHGTVMWKIDSGEGQFEGASGYITSNFIITAEGDVTDYQFGVIWVK